jgi:hypothetical protein
MRGPGFNPSTRKEKTKTKKQNNKKVDKQGLRVFLSDRVFIMACMIVQTLDSPGKGYNSVLSGMKGLILQSKS